MTVKKFECDMKFEKVAKRTGNKYSKWEFIGWSKLPNLDLAKWKELYMKGEYLHIEYHNGEHERYLVGKDFDYVTEFHIMKLERERLENLEKYIANFYAMLEAENVPDNVNTAVLAIIEEYEELKRNH